MKTRISNVEKKTNYVEFPILMVHHNDSEFIVLFLDSHTGICVHRGDGNKITFVKESNWDISLFKVFYGEVGLANF
jgi:hypothetical protein